MAFPVDKWDCTPASAGLDKTQPPSRSQYWANSHTHAARKDRKWHVVGTTTGEAEEWAPNEFMTTTERLIVAQPQDPFGGRGGWCFETGSAADEYERRNGMNGLAVGHTGRE